MLVKHDLLGDESEPCNTTSTTTEIEYMDIKTTTINKNKFKNVGLTRIE